MKRLWNMRNCKTRKYVKNKPVFFGIDKQEKRVNNINVGRESLNFNRAKDSAVHPTIEFSMLLLRLQMPVIALLFFQP